MKAKIITLLFSLFLLIGFSVNESYAQPGPPSSHGSTGDEAPSGGGAPLAGGIGLLVALGAAYGARKWYMNNKEE
jgi:hypothetical protein